MHPLGSLDMSQTEDKANTPVTESFLATMRNKYFPDSGAQTEKPVEQPEMGSPTGNFKKYIDDNYILPAARFREAAQKEIVGDFDSLFQKVVQIESKGQHRTPSGRLTKSRAGALGITQLMPDTAKKPGYGIDPVKDDSEEEYLRVGKSLLQAYTDSFGGDIAKGLAAYNWGPGNLNKAIDKHGVNWRDALPAETSNYLKKLLGKKQNGS